MVKLLLPILLLISVNAAYAGQGVINGALLDDPTGPWGAVEPVARSQSKAKVRIPSLQAIFVRDNAYIAIMNDKEVQAGSWVSGFKVRRVTKDFVYFVRKDKEYRLSLFGSKIKH